MDARMKIPRDVLGGLALIAVGIVFYVGGLNLRVGTMIAMGPGFFPRMVAVLLIGVGLAVAVIGFINWEKVGLPEWRPMIAVLGAIGVFGVVMSQFGLIPAMILGVICASWGDTSSRFWPAVLLATGAGVAAWLVFRVGLGLQMPGLRIPAWL
jgi:putative tricarboxylic transport membrane protein